MPMQDFFRRTFNDVSVKLTVTNAVGRATDSSNISLSPTDSRTVCNLALEHPKPTLMAIRTKLNPLKPASAHLALLLFEDCVNSGNSALHDVLEEETEVHDALLALATRRGADPSGIQLQRSARRVVLEMTRMFEAMGAHPKLASLMTRYEAATGRNLLRAVVTEGRRVRVNDPTPDCYRAISPIKREPRVSIRVRTRPQDAADGDVSPPAPPIGSPTTVARVQAVQVDDDDADASAFVAGTVVGAVQTGRVLQQPTTTQGRTAEASHADPTVVCEADTTLLDSGAQQENEANAPESGSEVASAAAASVTTESAAPVEPASESAASATEPVEEAATESAAEPAQASVEDPEHDVVAPVPQTETAADEPPRVPAASHMTAGGAPATEVADSTTGEPAAGKNAEPAEHAAAQETHSETAMDNAEDAPNASEPAAPAESEPEVASPAQADSVTEESTELVAPVEAAEAAAEADEPNDAPSDEAPVAKKSQQPGGKRGRRGKR